MSETQHPSANGGGTGGGQAGSSYGAQGLPARNMADIARLFLEGARPGTPSRAPRRTPPAASSAASDLRQESAAPGKNARPGEAATVMLALAAGAHSGASAHLLLQAAHGLAEEHATTVALVSMLPSPGGSRWTFVTDIVGVESADELPLVRAASDSGPPDMQIARALHRLRPAVGMWLIAAPGPDTRPFPAIASIVHHWLLACRTDNDGLVAGYQLLKHAWIKGSVGTAPIMPSAYLLSEDYAHAAIVHRRLRKAAQEFLKTDLALAGAGPGRARAGGGGASQEPVRVLSIAADTARHGGSGADAEESLWAAVLDELCPMSASDEQGVDNEVETALHHVENDAAQLVRHSSRASEFVLDHLAQVLDPEERAALALDFDDPPAGALSGPAVPGEIPPDPATAAAPDQAPITRNGQPHEAASRRLNAPAAAAPANKPRPAPAPCSPAPVAAPLMEMPPTSAERAGPQATEAPAAQGAGRGDEPAALRAFDLEKTADREAQWQAVERSIWDLSPRSALLDARPPMSWATETCIAIDAAGRVNVWTLYKDGVSWFALREWAHEHRNLLALTRRDLTVDRGAEVAVHIVLPLEETGEESAAAGGDRAEQSAADPIPTLLRSAAKNIHLYRLRQVHWGTRRGILVVPIA